MDFHWICFQFIYFLVVSFIFLRIWLLLLLLPSPLSTQFYNFKQKVNIIDDILGETNTIKVVGMCAHIYDIDYYYDPFPVLLSFVPYFI